MRRTKIYEMTTCALFAALMCIFGPMSLEIGPVPISLTNLVIYIAVYLLGAKGAAISYMLYLLLGAVGLPVFSDYSGGLGKLLGPTGGYLAGFVFICIIGGIVIERTNANPVWAIAALIVSTAIAYAFGTVWFIIVAKYELNQALAVCVYPFIPFDLAKIVIATVLGKTVRTALCRAGLINLGKG